MDTPTFYKWHVNDDDLNGDDIFDESERHYFTLNHTEIKFGLIFRYGNEDLGEDYHGLHLKLLDLAGESSVAIQFRLWVENAIGRKVMEKPLEFKHTFTKVDEKVGAEEFMLIGHLFSIETEFNKYKSITFCCEVLRIKPNPETWPDSKFREDSHSLYKSGIISNCVLKANGQDFNVPKNLLMASSQVFKNMLISDTEESRSNSVKIEDVSSEVLEDFIKHLHVGKLDESNQLVEALFVFADRYIAENLMAICIETLVKTLTKDNVARRIKLAFTYNNSELKNRLLFYLTNYGAEGNFYEMMKSDEWHKLVGENKQLADEIVDTYVNGTKSF